MSECRPQVRRDCTTGRKRPGIHGSLVPATHAPANGSAASHSQRAAPRQQRRRLGSYLSSPAVCGSQERRDGIAEPCNVGGAALRPVSSSEGVTMRMTSLKILPVLTLIGGSLLFSAVSGPAAASVGSLQAKVAPAQPSTPPSGQIAQTEADGHTFCLDAVAVGSDAGKNGDAVVLYDCVSGSNQLWYEGPPYPGANGDFHDLHSVRYPNLCLNVNDAGGVTNGSVVQLWSCSTAYNELWNFYYFTECLGLTEAACPLKLDADAPDGDALVLEALDAAPNSGDLKNGDQILVYEYSSAANRNWTSGQFGG